MTELVDELEQVYKDGPFSFGRATGSGKALFVGEGNLSFSLSLASSRRIAAGRITASVFEGPRQISPQTKEDAAKLSALGATVKYGVDAQRLKDTTGPAIYDLIAFPIPQCRKPQP